MISKSKILDCITFFDNNFMFELRYNILFDYVDYFIVCESLYDHKNNIKTKNFIWKNYYDSKKIKYYLIEEPFPSYKDRWKNQAIQREFLLNSINFAEPDDYIFFSDPDEIIKPELLKNFVLKKNMEYFCRIVLIINSTFIIHTNLRGKGLECAKKKILNQLIL